MTYEAAVQFLFDLRLFGLNLGLETPRRLAGLAGEPQRSLRFIHVAGTNGKGSTCAMLESIYRAAGLRVGLFTSPHLVSFTERLQVNRQPIAEADVARLVAELMPLLKEFPPDTHPTFFEVLTVLGLLYFAEQRCDLVIWETGLGGRLDATNIVTPLASVITNIQFDHQQWLGDTLGKIAGEKAGIIKPGVPVITGADSSEALEVIRREAARNGSTLIEIGPEKPSEPPLSNIRLPLGGKHQRQNAAVALATVEALQAILPVAAENIKSGLETVHWAGRLQRIERDGRVILLDGAHNPAGVLALRDTLQSDYAGQPLALVLGTLQDKEWQEICKALAPLAGKIVVTRVASDRTADPGELADACRKINPAAEISKAATLGEALALVAAEPVAVITGSLYLIGEALELLCLPDTAARSERGLNEWRSTNMK